MEKQKLSIADMFGVNVPKKAKVVGLSTSDINTPEVDTQYSFRLDLLRDVLAWWNYAPKGEGIYLTGPTGSGKSSLILQIMARLGWPVQRVTGHTRMEFSDLVGRPVIQTDGSMGFQYGPLARAMKEGHLFLLDELDMLDPGTSAGLNGIVQGEPLTIAENGGEVITPHPDFRVAATGNTVGDGDDGFYVGVSRQNEAFMDRFWVVHVDYPEPEIEGEILQQVSSLDKKGVKPFLDVAAEVRKQHTQGMLDVTFSTRVLKRWAQMTEFFYSVSAQDKSPVHYALDRALLFRAEETTRNGVHEIAQRYFGE